MKRLKKINLNNRLFLCAQNVRPQKVVADVGTDHAYLPIWLVLNDIIPYAFATDVREGPLLNAQNNVIKYGAEKKIELKLSDGLDSLSGELIDDVVIAGMGGELIIKIISRANWLRDKTKHLILQPMSAEVELREFLAKENFRIDSEKAVVSAGKIYTVMSVFFEENLKKGDKIYPYIGGLRDDMSEEACIYIKKTIRDLKNKLKGYIFTNNEKKATELKDIIIDLEKMVGDNIND